MRLLPFSELKEYLDKNSTKRTIQKQYGHHHFVAYEINGTTITIDLHDEVVLSCKLPSGYTLYDISLYLGIEDLYIAIQI